MQIIGIISLQALYFLLLHQIESKKINPQKKNPTQVIMKIWLISAKQNLLIRLRGSLELILLSLFSVSGLLNPATQSCKDWVKKKVSTFASVTYFWVFY